MRNSQGGWTLLHCLALLVILMILGAVEFRLVLTQKRLVNLAGWGRAAEALADGALELALAHLEAGNTGPLRRDLTTGVAEAKIIPGTSAEEYQITFRGLARSAEKNRIERAYAATAYRASDGNWKVRGIERRTSQTGATGE